MKIVSVAHDYPYPADDLWAIATDFGDLATVTEGLVRFSGLPEGRCKTGQKIEVRVSLFGWFPEQDYRMEVVECDDADRVLRSSEQGGVVRQWRHTMRVVETPAGSRLTDDIEIDAGWWTPLIAAWARYLYKSRHKPRLKLLAQRAGRDEV